jgi:hypothetical protein
MTQHDVESLYVWGGDGRWIAVPPQRDSKSGDDQLYVRTNSKPDGSTWTRTCARAHEDGVDGHEGAGVLAPRWEVPGADDHSGVPGGAMRLMVK